MKAKIAHCNLNQSAIDFNGNKRRIFESIRRSRELKCTYRACQELEIPGYGCMDHFKELDTYKHSWEVLADMLEDPDLLAGDIIVETSMAVIHRGASFNCKIILFNRKIILIRPKLFLADGGAGNESRWFVAYSPMNDNRLEQFLLPKRISEITGQTNCPFGIATIKTKDADISLEICEEVWRLNSPSRSQILNSDILFGCNGSYFSIDKLKKRISTIKSGVQNFSGAYVYCNAVGCDGDRIYFDGANIVVQNGEIIDIGEKCSLEEVNVTTVVIDLTQIRQSKLSDICNMREAADFKEYNCVHVDFHISSEESKKLITNKPIKFVNDPIAVQIMDATSGYLWDYLRKSGARGFYLPLSGGADSGVTALLVYNFAERILEGFKRGSEFITSTFRRIIKNPEFTPETPRDIVKEILFTCYLPSQYSSDDSKQRADDIAKFVGSNHIVCDITPLIDEFSKIAKMFLEKQAKFASEGGSLQEDISLQNVQARCRMVICYLFAQLAPVKYNKDGFLLVMGTGNVNETILGYFTKYDCSSGDINLIGSVSKKNIYKIFKQMYEKYKDPSIKAIWDAKPSAELRPPNATGEQTDTADIGLTYNDIFSLTQLRNVSEYGIVSSFEYLCDILPDVDKELIYVKLRRFYQLYRTNRHKTTILTPSVHISSNSCDDARYDFRPFLYESNFDYEFQQIESLILASRGKSEDDKKERAALNESSRKMKLTGNEESISIKERYVQNMGTY